MTLILNVARVREPDRPACEKNDGENDLAAARHLFQIVGKFEVADIGIPEELLQSFKHCHSEDKGE